MDDVRASPGETDAGRTARLQREAALIAEAEQEIAEGKGITGAELERFMAWFVSGDDGPPPDVSDAAY
jgi:hypothetical protein